MPVDVVVPQIGEAISELRIVSWLKQVGDSVKAGDVLFEVDSDKAIVEVEAFVDGTLIEIMQPADSSVLPQQVVARIRLADEAAAETVSPAPDAHSRPASELEIHQQVQASPLAQRVAADLGVDLRQVAGSGPGQRITAEDVRQFAARQTAPPAADRTPRRPVASPKARRLAKERGLDLTGLVGTGVDGMIVVSDLERAAAAAAPTAHVGRAPAAAAPRSRLRQTIAARMVESKQQVPHFYLMVDVDMTQVNQLRLYCQQAAGWEHPPTYTDVFVRACALTLADMPSVNCSFHPDGLAQHEHIAIGVATNTDAGLLVPVIADANRLSLKRISDAVRDVARRAREGRLKPGDTGPKSMVVSNLGMYGVDAFLAIIDMPDPMILAVGRVADRVVALDKEIAIRPMCTLTLSVDHRALDGAQGAQFLQRLQMRLENPFDLLGDSA